MCQQLPLPLLILPSPPLHSYASYNLSAPLLPTGLAFSSKLRPVMNKAFNTGFYISTYDNITISTYGNLGNTTYAGLK